MKKESVLIVLLNICLCGALIFIYYNHQKAKFEGAPHLEKTYILETEKVKSCIIFHEKGQFFEYDCDSEPTNMQFSGEFCHKFSYNVNKKSITFFCEENSGLENIRGKVEAKVIEWTKDKMIIEYEDFYNGLTRDIYYSEEYLSSQKSE